jgi:hypothetical protein
MTGRGFKLAIVVVALASFAPAQSKKRSPAKPAQPTIQQRVIKAKADVIAAARSYKESLQKLLDLQENEVKFKAEIVEKRKALLEQQIISKREVEQGEKELVDARAKVADTRKQMGETDHLIAEVSAEEKLAKLGPARPNTYQATAALIRYSGSSQWMLSNVSKVQGFFVSRFNRGLPISAFGQTAVHDRLGFNHSNSVDVAVHPDSAEGEALMAYLRGAGIPFLAFRQAVAGVATGAHIHIGYPSRRLSR